MVGFPFAPVDWLPCNGQSLAISEYSTLFALIGTTYGGDGQNNFNLPDLQSRVPIHQGSDGSGNTYQLASTGGQQTVTLNTNTLATHSHPFKASANAGSTGSPTNALPAIYAGSALYVNDSTNKVVAFASNGIAPMGSGAAHNNLMPYLCINFVIATEGAYPSPS